METIRIKDYDVQVERLHQSSGASPFFCQVFKGSKRILSVTIPEADTPAEAARIAADLIL